MSSYIKYMFKYLFEPDSLHAELASDNATLAGGANLGVQPILVDASNSLINIPLISGAANSTTSTATNGSGLLSSGHSGPSLAALSVADELARLVVSGTLAATGSNHSAAHPAGGRSPINKSTIADWLWQTIRSATASTTDSQATAAAAATTTTMSMPTSNSKLLLPSKCLEFARTFAAALATTTSSSTTSAATTTLNTTQAGALVADRQQASPIGSGQSTSTLTAGLQATHLGTFAEFEHLIRRKLAAATSSASIGSSAGSTNNSTASNNGNNNNNNSPNWQALSSGATPNTNTAAAAASNSPLSSLLSPFLSSASSSAGSEPRPLPASSTGPHSAGLATLIDPPASSWLGLMTSTGTSANLATSSSSTSNHHRLVRLSERAASLGTRAVATMLAADDDSNQPSHLHGVRLAASAGPSGQQNWSPAAAAANATTAGSTWAGRQRQQQILSALSSDVNSLELLECYNQLQLADYYNGYDIFVGLRIACTLGILFIVFILFVIYKTGCGDDGERTSRSQLRLNSSATSAPASTSSHSRAKRMKAARLKAAHKPKHQKHKLHQHQHQLQCNVQKRQPQQGRCSAPYHHHQAPPPPHSFNLACPSVPKVADEGGGGGGGGWSEVTKQLPS